MTLRTRGNARGVVAVTRVPLARLHPAEWNPRTITDERFENLKRSLQADPRLLELRPILATADGEVYAGNMRLRAAIALGWADVPAVLEDVDERTKRERMVRDNAQWGDWEDDSLARILDLGVEDADISRLLDGIQTIGPEADNAPRLDEAPTRAHAGDLWQLGEHRLLCGDSANAGHVSRLMGGRGRRALD